MVTMWDPVKSQNVSILRGGPVLLHRVAPLLDQTWHLCNHDDHGDDEDHNVEGAPLLDQSWHLFDVAHEPVVEELVEHHDNNSAEIHFAREDN